MRMVITTGDLEEGAHHVSEELYKKVMLLIMSETHPEWSPKGNNPMKCEIVWRNGYAELRVTQCNADELEYLKKQIGKSVEVEIRPTPRAADLPTDCPNGHGPLFPQDDLLFCDVCKFTVSR